MPIPESKPKFGLDVVTFEYINYKGERETRTVRPIRLWFGSTSWHPEAGWLLEAWDVDRQGTRDFSMSGMQGSWTRSSDQKVVNVTPQ